MNKCLDHNLKPVLFANTRIVDPSQDMDVVGDVLISDGVIVGAGRSAVNQGTPEGCEIVDATSLIVIPGLVDACAFIGSLDFSSDVSKTFELEEAAAGGITSIVIMPDTKPIIDNPALISLVQHATQGYGGVNVSAMAAVTKGLEGRLMTEIGLLSEAGAIAFTDGRCAIASVQMMKNALTYARNFGAIIVNHVADPTFASGMVNPSVLTTKLGLPSIAVEAETIMLERDIQLTKLSRSRYHASRISSSESIEIIGRAKSANLDVSCGVSIKHLCFNDTYISYRRSDLKLSPPIRSERDRLALLRGIQDGTIDMIVSAHNPQNKEQKCSGFKDAPFGAPAFKTFLADGLQLVSRGEISLSKLINAMSTQPARRFNLDGGTLKVGSPANLALIGLANQNGRVHNTPAQTLSDIPFTEVVKSHNLVLRTIAKGRTVFSTGYFQ